MELQKKVGCEPWANSRTGAGDSEMKREWGCWEELEALLD